MVIRRGVHKNESEQMNEVPVEEEPSKGKQILQSFGHAFVTGMKQIVSAVRLLIGKIRKDENVLWDDGANNNIANADEMKGIIINVVFIVYGLIAGFIAQNYSAYLCRKFAAWACGVGIASEYIVTSPLTTIMSGVIILVVYTGSFVCEGLIYWIFKLLYEKDLYNGKEQMQVAYVYGLLTNLLMSLICFMIPGNVFMWFV